MDQATRVTDKSIVACPIIGNYVVRRLEHATGQRMWGILASGRLRDDGVVMGVVVFQGEHAGGVGCQCRVRLMQPAIVGTGVSFPHSSALVHIPTGSILGLTLKPTAHTPSTAVAGDECTDGGRRCEGSEWVTHLVASFGCSEGVCVRVF